MLRRLAILTAPVVLVLTFAGSPAGAATGPPPASMAALGDSITRGFNACGWFVDCTSRSWSVGDNTTVNSHYLRIRAKNPAIAGKAHNVAQNGANSADLLGQVRTAIKQQAGYVTILIGANDACTSSEAAMTPIETFRGRLDTALAALKQGLPGARVFVISVPDLKRLWAIGKGKVLATTRWALFNVCQSILAKATSTAAVDNARRDRVRARVMAYNAQLAAACAAYGPNCRYDKGALFAYPFVLGQISAWDYFHPNATGQKVLADLSYPVGFGW